jgi:hypothetical protein
MGGEGRGGEAEGREEGEGRKGEGGEGREGQRGERASAAGRPPPTRPPTHPSVKTAGFVRAFTVFLLSFIFAG